MNTTNKSKRRPYDAMYALAVKQIAKAFDVTESYVRMINGDTNKSGGQCEEIRRAFNAKYQALKQAIA